MKKEIKLENVLFIGVIVVIIYVLTICMFMNRINGYEEKLEKSGNDYEKVVTENDNLKDHINDLNSNIYNLFNKQPYKLTIEHDDSRITYEQDKFGLFDSYHSITTKSSIIGE